jgi:hypothetical protein
MLGLWNPLLLSSPTVEALTEQIFQLAINAEDAHTIEKMIKLGINPNKQVCRNSWGGCETPLLQVWN